MKRKSIIVLVTLASLFLVLQVFSALSAEKYIASTLREPFHTLSCRWAKKIAPSNAVYYATREEAIADGHRPCRVCKP